MSIKDFIELSEFSKYSVVTKQGEEIPREEVSEETVIESISVVDGIFKLTVDSKCIEQGLNTNLTLAELLSICAQNPTVYDEMGNLYDTQLTDVVMCIDEGENNLIAYTQVA